jgi:hypothetical protein
MAFFVTSANNGKISHRGGIYRTQTRGVCEIAMLYTHLLNQPIFKEIKPQDIYNLV